MFLLMAMLHYIFLPIHCNQPEEMVDSHKTPFMHLYYYVSLPLPLLFPTVSGKCFTLHQACASKHHISPLAIKSTKVLLELQSSQVKSSQLYLSISLHVLDIQRNRNYVSHYPMRRQASDRTGQTLKCIGTTRNNMKVRTKTTVRFGNEMSFVAWLLGYNRDGLWGNLRKI